MVGDLTGRKVAVLATDGVEQVELTAPWNALKEARADTSIVSIKKGSIQGFIHEEKADTFKVDALVGDVSARDFDAPPRPVARIDPTMTSAKPGLRRRLRTP